MQTTKVALSGNTPTTPHGPTPTDAVRADGQKADHWILPESERAKGFVRPVREKYVHSVCGAVTRMPLAIAETYARDPYYYGKTFCCSCKGYFPVGQTGEFLWDDNSGEKVGS